MTSSSSGPQSAVWYFVAATFILAAPLLFFPNAGIIWLNVGSIVLGAIIFTLGVVVFRREQLLRRAARDSGDPRG